MATPSRTERFLRRLARLGAFVLAGACCASPPTAEELFDRGFRSPTQTFRTFQTGVRSDDGRTEYRCLSTRFRRRHLLSQLLYLEFRDKWFASKPWLRAAIADARIVGVTFEEGDDPRRCVLTAAALGERLAVHLVREDFVQLYDGSELVVDEALDSPSGFSDSLAVTVPDGFDRARVRGEAVLSTSIPPERVTELRIGQDWKVDDIEKSEDPPETDGAP
ncbi:MAG: hypothetical protein QF903_12930 [Planctomycetota bacterium]|jgi:hypothetical protein|nr:hypothetical protein [Planctomycetota bacterium]MDP6764181.1 hypothetical protein [Planctomycetota bacterium]MDP6990367.1 hypothetical protein [Planctomycetota bacterium]